MCINSCKWSLFSPPFPPPPLQGQYIFCYQVILHVLTHLQAEEQKAQPWLPQWPSSLPPSLPPTDSCSTQTEQPGQAISLTLRGGCSCQKPAGKWCFTATSTSDGYQNSFNVTWTRQVFRLEAAFDHSGLFYKDNEFIFNVSNLVYSKFFQYFNKVDLFYRGYLKPVFKLLMTVILA